MPQQNPFQHTASTFQAVTGISIEPEHIELLLRLHRVSNFWGRTSKQAADGTPAAAAPHAPASPVTIESPFIPVTAGASAFPTPPGSSQRSDEQTVSVEPVKTETGTIEAPLHRPPVKAGERFYITSDFAKDPYYPWQIIVICRLKNSANSYAVNFSGRPTMEEFAEHYAKFEGQTHWVHVNDFTGREKKVVSETFWKELREYRKNPKTGPVQEAQAGEVSAEEKPFKLTYFVGENKTADKHYETAPAAWVIAYHNNAYGKAFVTELK